jgi:hypothetical protein
MEGRGGCGEEALRASGRGAARGSLRDCGEAGGAGRTEHGAAGEEGSEGGGGGDTEAATGTQAAETGAGGARGTGEDSDRTGTVCP